MEERWQQTFDLLSLGTFPDGFDMANKRSLRKYASKFKLKEGDLYIGDRRAIKSKEEARELFVEFHCSPTGRHTSIMKTRTTMSSRFYWLGMAVDINNWHRLQTATPPRLADKPIDEEYNQTHSSSSSAPTDNIKDKPETPEHRLQTATRPLRLRSRAGDPPSPSLVTVKDKHIDEENKQTLFSSSSAPTDYIKNKPETPEHRLQTATRPLRLRSRAGDPPSPSLVTVKDKHIDEEYKQTLFSSSSAPTDDIKNKPETPEHRLQTATRPLRLRSRAGGPPSPSLVTVKDKHIDEEYKQTLFSSSSAPTDDIKNKPETPEHGLQTATRPLRLRSRAGDPPSPSLVTVKDKHIDEEYKQTLFSSSSAPTDDIKNKPETPEHRLQTATRPLRLRSPAGDPPSPSLVTVKDKHTDEEYKQTLFSSSSAPTDDIKDKPETPEHRLQTATRPLGLRSRAGDPPSPSLVMVKDKHIDEEYKQTLFSSSSAPTDDIKDKPETPEVRQPKTNPLASPA
ncbi:Gypsy retrotransposon integrase-like protein 1 [Merluccius polli]|uniref:Gypsy retrotransposon integrase-like protein 1 n=1 Tax=Merluccius polli TaxID=89951 RepID=A0AA47MAF5_MERPO|nr:Gypsy retrotransposon integrase-like protein 1 [Merluccius polli]